MLRYTVMHTAAELDRKWFARLSARKLYVNDLYLSLVRRMSVWLEPVLPPEASAAPTVFRWSVHTAPIVSPWAATVM